MNRLLADAVIALNKLGAIIIIVVFLVIGHGIASGAGLPEQLGLFIGGVVGILVAGFFCGIVALLALIENHLRVLEERTRKPTHASASAVNTPSKKVVAKPDAWSVNSSRTPK